jgi:arylsulfatase A-like enzyme
MTNYQPFLGIISTLLLCSLGISCSVETEKSVRPNILFIFADDQRADALGAFGNPYIRTPNLDRLASNGVRFSNSYVMGGHHGAICAPSRAMMLSGKSLFNVYDRLDGVLTFPKYLSQQGYQTFATGKWHNGAPSFEANFQTGNSVMLGGMSNHFKVPLRNLESDGKLGEPREEGFSTDLFADAALNFLDSYGKGNRDQPFLCYLAFTAPHDPRSPHEKYQNAYADDALPVPGNFKALHPFQFDDFNVRDETLAPWPRTPEVIQSSLAEYYALIQHLDNRVGNLINRLDSLDLLDNTLIVYAADNGLALGSHGLLGKQNLYEHSTKVPLIISGPGIPHGQTSDALVYLYDLFPTLMEYLNVPAPEGLNGSSLMPLIEKKQEEVRSSLYTAYRNTIRAVRDKQWKLIYYPQLGQKQLFNLEDDPLELNNLANNPDNQNKIDAMMEMIKEHRTATNDTINLYPEHLQSGEYDYTTLKQTPDPWQPEYNIRKYFPEEVWDLER